MQKTIVPKLQIYFDCVEIQSFKFKIEQWERLKYTFYIEVSILIKVQIG